MTTLYDDLGVPADASAEDVRRAYRGLARQLHPDLNRAPGSDERMRRVNHAWTVLGNPATRDRYDQSLAAPAPPETAAPPRFRAGAGPPPLRWLRPSVLAVAVLTVIFIATAYAGPHPGGRAPVSVPSTADTGRSRLPADQPSSGLVDSPLVGQCVLVLTGYDAIVPCSEHNDGLVVGQSTHSADCPPGTAVHQLAGRSQFVCLAGPPR